LAAPDRAASDPGAADAELRVRLAPGPNVRNHMNPSSTTSTTNTPVFFGSRRIVVSELLNQDGKCVCPIRRVSEAGLSGCAQGNVRPCRAPSRRRVFIGRAGARVHSRIN
jgi:hypothetical protein